MPETALIIANRALQQCGARATIESFDETSNEAKNLKLIFDKTARDILVQVRWNFAFETTRPVQIIPAQPLRPPWRYAFRIPANALYINGVFDEPAQSSGVPIFGAALAATNTTPGFTVPWALIRANGERFIVTQYSKILVSFTAQISDFDQWPPLAIEALEYALAAKLALPLSGDKTLARMMHEKADESLIRARTLNANEDVSIQEIPTDWLQARSFIQGIGDNSLPEDGRTVMSDDMGSGISGDGDQLIEVV